MKFVDDDDDDDQLFMDYTLHNKKWNTKRKFTGRNYRCWSDSRSFSTYKQYKFRIFWHQHLKILQIFLTYKSRPIP